MSDQYAVNRVSFRDWFLERELIFRRLAWSLLALIAVTFVLMVWVLARPNPYDEHESTHAATAAWPDGSPKTPNDWWASAASNQIAQPPKESAPASGSQSAPPSPNGG